MRALSAPELLNVWERGLMQPLFQRVLTLLSAACPETSFEELAELSLGQRDARVLTLREWTFGSQVACVVACSQCGERLEMTVNTTDLRVSPEQPMESRPLSFRAEDYEVQFRLPNSLDLQAIADQHEVTTARQVLLTRCLSVAQYGGEPIAVSDLPASVVESVVEHMAQADPQADVQFALACPQCGQQWQSTFDIAALFWSELAAWAQRVMREVHILASAYGWRELDILHMSSWRRQQYLNLVNG